MRNKRTIFLFWTIFPFMFIAYMAFILSGCAMSNSLPTGPSEVVRDEINPEVPNTPTILSPPPIIKSSLTGCEPQTSWQAVQLKNLINYIVSEANYSTGQTYGLVVLFHIHDTNLNVSHSIEGELRRSHPRLVAEETNYDMVYNGLNFASKDAMLAAMRVALPSNVKVRMKNTTEDWVYGCASPSIVKGYFEGDW